MGLFSRKSRTRVKPDLVVLCAFRELARANPLRNFDPEYAYAYRWGLPTPPRVGQWAVVDGYEGPATVIVGAIGTNSYVKQSEVASLAVITRLVPDAKVARAQASLAKKAATADAEEAAWLSHCRWVAGVDASEPAAPVPAGYEIPALPDDSASVELADRHGDSWWRVANEAEKRGHSEADLDQLKDVARSWYRIRDAAVKAEQIAAVKSAATEEQLDRAIRDLESGKDLGDKPGYFLGRFMADWLRYVEALAKFGEADRALALAYALITVAEREAVVSGREPAPGYTERAAILHRKRKEYREEIAVIERWENACPRERRGPGATQVKLAQRLKKARELALTQGDPA